MKNRGTTNIKCDLCGSISHEQKVILMGLLKNIKKLAEKPQFQQCQDFTKDQDCQGFARLMKAINVGKPPRSRFHSPCLHLKWLKIFRRQLACDMGKLNYLCHLTTNRVSQRNYHLYLLEMQVKNISETLREMNPEEKAVKIEQVEDYEKRELIVEEGGERVKEQREAEGPVGITQPSIQELGIPNVGKQVGYYIPYQSYQPNNQP